MYFIAFVAFTQTELSPGCDIGASPGTKWARTKSPRCDHEPAGLDVRGSEKAILILRGQ
jgi:hypothetical protein